MKTRTTSLRTLLLVLLGTMLGKMSVSAQTKQAYAYVSTADRETLYFYYDTQRSSRNSTGNTFNMNAAGQTPEWYTYYDDPFYLHEKVRKVVFDKSFGDYSPTSTCYWFASMQFLTTIEGFNYLYTPNVTDMSYMFLDCYKLSTLDFRNKSGSELNMTDNYIFNTAKVTSMKYMFFNCRSLTTLDLSGWDTRAVTNMEQMFKGCTSLKTLILGKGYVNGTSSEYEHGWDTSNVTNMDLMFAGCSNLQTIKVGENWSTYMVNASNKLFTGCTSLVGGAGSAFATLGNSYNSPTYARIDQGSAAIGYFTAAYEPYVHVNYKTVSFYCDEMRERRTSGNTYDLNAGGSMPGWYLSPQTNDYTKVVIDKSFAKARPTSCSRWFVNMQNLESFEGIQYLNTSKVTNMSYMFCLCAAIGDIDFASLSNFTTNNVTSMAYMFSQCKSLVTLNLTKFNTAKVTGMTNMFSGCTNLTNIYVTNGNFKVDQVTSSSQMFYNCPKLVGGQGTKYNSSHTDKEYAHIDGGEENPGYFSQKPYAVYNPSNRTLTFYADGLSSSKPGTTYSLNQGQETPMWYKDNFSINVQTVVFHSSFANIRPTTTYAWFLGMANLTTITDIENLNTSEVTNMDYMFSSCSSLKDVDLSHFNTAKVTSMHATFDCCSALKSLDLAEWNTENVTNMIQMFKGCTSLESLDMSGWNTAKVSNMFYMFGEDSNLKTIYASNKWTTSGLGGGTTGSDLFKNCTKLVGSKGTAYSSSHTGKEYAHLDGGTSDPGYFSIAPYAVYNNGTLTFYYDGNRNAKTGTKYSMNAPGKAPGWLDNKESVTKVVFHSSFADARPVSTTSWFYGMQNLTTITGINYLNTSEVTNMYCMFYKCSQLTSLDLSGFNTSKVTSTRSMFRSCSQLKSIYISNSWSTANVTNSETMFTGCTNLMGGGGTTYDASHISLDYAHADQGATNPGYLSYKPYAVRFTNSNLLHFYADGNPGNKSGTIYDLNTGDEDVSWSAISSAITGIAFDASFANARPTSTKNWFNNMTKLTSISWIERLHTDQVTTMEAMLKNCSALTTANLTSFNTEKVTSMKEMFSGCTNLATINISSRWKTDNVTSSADMFSGCNAIVGGNGTTYDASHIDKEYARLDVEGTPGYFSSEPPYLILSLDEKTLTLYNDGLSGEKEGTLYNFTTNYQTTVPWRTKASGITKVVFDPSFATARPQWVNGWFSGMTNLTTIEGMEYFNFTETRRFNNLFGSCTSLVEIDLSHFTPDTGCAMGEMFYGCSNLETIYVASKWTLNIVSNGDNMFFGCTKLVGGKGTTFDPNYPGRDYARIDGGTSSPGYLTNGAREYYGTWDSTTSTLTHYYDAKKNKRAAEGKEVIDGQGYELIPSDGQGYLYLQDIEKVVYDESCAMSDGLYDVWYCSGMNNLTSIEGLEYFDTSNMTDFSNMFKGCESLASLDLSTFDTRKATNMSYMFYGCKMLDNLTLGENFSTANVTNMSYMLGDGCFINALQTVLHHENFSTENVTNMQGMFTNIQGTNVLDLSRFNTAKVTNMTSMFDGCSSLTTIFVGPDWTTAAVTSSNFMFTGCTNIVGGAGTTHNSSKVTAEYAHIDGGTANPGYFTGIAYTPYAVLDETTATLSFYADNKQVEKEGAIYSLPAARTSPDWMIGGENLRKVVFDPSFITARPTSLFYWFANQLYLEEIEGIENLVTSEVTDMESLFQGCLSLTKIDLTGFDTHQVTNMDYMFWECQHLQTIYVGNGWTTANVNSGVGMFNKCFSLEGSAGTQYDHDIHGGEVDVRQFAHVDGGLGSPGLLSGKIEAYVQKSTDYKTLTFYYDAMRLVRGGETYDLNTSTNRPGWDDYRPTYVTTVIFDPLFANARPTSTCQWFYNMTNLSDIQGLEYLNTSEVTTMNQMFRYCRSLTNLDLSSFDTQKVTDMGSMFNACAGLKNIDLSSFNTNHRMSFNWMFGDCTSLEVLDLSNFNTSAVYNTANMFNGCTALKTIYVGDEWNAQGVSSSTQMFKGCLSIVGGAGTIYDANHVDKAYAHVDGGTSNPGYLTYLGAYAVLANNTLTFYSDAKKNERAGTVYSLNQGTEAPAWYTDGSAWNITMVVFDPSFADARPTTTNDWFVTMVNLVNIEGLEYLNTSEVTNMESMFSRCEKLENIDVSGFDTRKVTTMSSMFNECNALKTLDLTNFDVSQVTNMQQMFYNCSSLTTIYAASNWNEGFDESLNSWSMFTGCTSLVGGGGTEWDSSYSNDIYLAQIDGGKMDPGYFTEGPAPSSMLGDVNGDNKVDVADVTALVNMLKSGNVVYRVAIDVDGDGSITNSDVKALVNLILGSVPAATVLNYQVKAKPNNDYTPVEIDLDQIICDAFGLTVNQISDKISNEFSTAVQDGTIMLYKYNNDGTFCSDNYNVGDPGYWMDKDGNVFNWSDGNTVAAFCFNKSTKKFRIHQYPGRLESGNTMKFLFALRYNNGGEMITVGFNINLTICDDIETDIVTLM